MSDGHAHPTPSQYWKIAAFLAILTAIEVALSYMVGRHRIDAMRRTAERALAASFSLPTFHDWLLENGAVPLSVLERSVDRRIAEAGGAAG